MGVFDGLRILELGSGAAAPVAARYFAEQGARVIRVESSTRPDFLRVYGLRPGNEHGLDGAPMFILLNPNKQSVTVNLQEPDGVAIVKRLVEWADVVSENFRPGVMSKYGLDYDSLVELQPDLIMVSGCLFGQTGPQRRYPGFGGQASAIAGFNHLTGWPDREAIGPFGTITDSLSPRFVALAITAALLHRKRTGKGQFIDVSQIEVGVYCLSETVARCSATDEVVSRDGNRHPTAAPHGVYPCAGDKRYVAIAVHSDDQWRALCDAMSDPEWSRDARFATVAGRKQHEAAIDEPLAAWTRGQDPHAVMEALQAAGVEAGAVQNEADLLRDPQLAHRRHFCPIDYPHLGEMQFEHAAVVLPETPRCLDRPGPLLGEHTEPVLAEVLGLTPEEISALSARDVLS